MQRVSPQPCVSFPSLLNFLFYFWFLCFASLRIIQHVLWSRKTKKQKLTHSSTNFTHSTLGENAKTSGPTETTRTKQKRKAGLCLCATSELSRRVQEGEGIKTKLACSPQANTVYIAVHANPINLIFFFYPFYIKTHTDVHYKKGFPFCKRAVFFFHRRVLSDAHRCGYVYIIYIYNRIKRCISLVYVYSKKQIHQIGSILLWNIFWKFSNIQRQRSWDSEKAGTPDSCKRMWHFKHQKIEIKLLWACSTAMTSSLAKNI